LRDTTERPVTVTQGSNRLLKVGEIEAAVTRVLNDDWPRGRRPDLWDGRAAFRAAESLRRLAGVQLAVRSA
jgi:UDP-N-acetylglucosamine 2-epimerase (non-hydrolysing)